MKKFIAITVFSFLAIFVHAQVNAPVTVTKTGDTLNVTNDTVYINLNQIPDGLKSVEINVNKVSGTLAGSARLQQSNGGSIWYDAGSSANDTLAIGNVQLQGKIWTANANVCANLRVMIIRTNGVAIPVVYYVRRDD